ncbi:MAG TPA: copper-containing nitrite reductase [Xanthobacteraceae bacterium]|nr:copper-containing nitrite reductase [Xanthobacteraceae bacterium]
MWAILREWYIVGLGTCLIAGGLFIASHETSRSAPTLLAQDSELCARPAKKSVSFAAAAKPSSLPAAKLADVRVEQTPPATPAHNSETAHNMIVAQATNAPAPATAGAISPGAGDPEAGRLVFRKCQACHSMEPGKNILGPSLAGIIGRKAGSESGYAYSPAMKQANIVWDGKSLDAYLNDPQKLVPGNKMPFPGLKTEHDRADIIAYLAAAAAGPQAASSAAATGPPTAKAPATQATVAPSPQANSAAGYLLDAKYTLRSGIAEGRMVYIGVGGAIDGKVNPVLTAAEGQVVELTLINGEGAEHDIVFPGQNAKSPRVTGKGASTTIAFRAEKSGDFTYFCSVPGHQLAGMQGQFIVTTRPPPQTLVEADISREPADLPPPIGKREPRTVRVDLLSVEVEGRLAEGTTFGYWTFNGKVPGPFIRVRVGDTVDIHLKNSADSAMIHSVDFHATTGPGGGAAVLQVDPGQEKSMTWKALIPGLYVYHCATPMVSEHIANGMYGLILVEPENGLPQVEHEFYVMQGEIYTDIPYGQHGSAEFSVEKLLNEHPEYFVFNGSVGALTKLHPLKAKVGDIVRIFFGVGGPNFTSSFHVIGEIFDKVYPLGGLESPPLEGIQTVSVAPGGAVITEFKTKVPGNYTLVDHALARLERGLVGILSVEGAPNPEIYNGQTMSGMGH